MKQSKTPAVGLPIMVDRNNKTDYYHDRTSLDACFKSGLLNKDHSHITLSDAKGWKLDSSGKGFVEFDPLADRGPEKYPGEHREYKFSDILAECRRKAAVLPPHIFPGARLFQLKATHGVPLEISLENLTNRSMVVDWVGFIKEARLSGWYDFQTLEVIQNALEDVFDRDVQEAISLRIKRFIMNNPLNRVDIVELKEILEKVNIPFPEFRGNCRPSEDGKWDRDEVTEVIRIIQTTPVIKLP